MMWQWVLSPGRHIAYMLCLCVCVFLLLPCICLCVCGLQARGRLHIYIWVMWTGCGQRLRMEDAAIFHALPQFLSHRDTLRKVFIFLWTPAQNLPIFLSSSFHLLASLTVPESYCVLVLESNPAEGQLERKSESFHNFFPIFQSLERLKWDKGELSYSTLTENEKRKWSKWEYNGMASGMALLWEDQNISHFAAGLTCSVCFLHKVIYYANEIL